MSIDKKRYPNHAFEIIHKDPNSMGRLGRLTTPHGTIETPNFIFCGTKAAMKNLSPRQMREAGADIMLSNTYHLMINTGPDIIQEMGGLHKFIGWDGPMFTDSGGFQIFAMGIDENYGDEIKARNRSTTKKSLLGIQEEGARFKSYLDGSELFLSPEISVQIQRKLGADLITQLDECTPLHVDYEYTKKSMEMSHRWGQRSLDEFDKENDGTQALYGIIQGGVFEDLRVASCESVNSMPFFGTAVGGCLGSSPEQFYEIVEWCMDWCMAKVDESRPVHLLGAGSTLQDIFKGVRMGIDTFDCVSPTRIARHGWALAKGVPGGRLNMRNACHKRDDSALDATTDCYASQGFSKAYIHHLIKANEMLAMQLVSQHNVAVMTRLMREVRAAMKDGTLDRLEKEWIVD